MKNSRVGLILILLCMVGFSYWSVSKDRSKLPSPSGATPGKSSVVVIDNAFVYRVVATDLVYKNIASVYKNAKIDKVVVNNIHWPEIKDTISTFQLEGDTIKFYHAQDKIIPFYLSISSPKLTLDKTIKTGISSTLLKSKFKLKSVPDTVIVSDLEAGFTFNLILNSSKTVVNKITFDCYID